MWSRPTRRVVAQHGQQLGLHLEASGTTMRGFVVDTGRRGRTRRGPGGRCADVVGAALVELVHDARTRRRRGRRSRGANSAGRTRARSWPTRASTTTSAPLLVQASGAAPSASSQAALDRAGAQAPCCLAGLRRRGRRRRREPAQGRRRPRWRRSSRHPLVVEQRLAPTSFGMNAMAVARRPRAPSRCPIAVDRRPTVPARHRQRRPAACAGQAAPLARAPSDAFCSTHTAPSADASTATTVRHRAGRQHHDGAGDGDRDRQAPTGRRWLRRHPIAAARCGGRCEQKGRERRRARRRRRVRDNGFMAEVSQVTETVAVTRRGLACVRRGLREQRQARRAGSSRA